MKYIDPCPFCGVKLMVESEGDSAKFEANEDPSYLSLEETKVGTMSVFYVQCGGCGCRGPEAIASRDDALALWRKRK